MQNITRATLAAIGILPFSLFGADALDSTDVINDSRLVIEWQQGKKVGGFLDAMMPFYGNNSHIWFTDFQAYQYGTQYQTLGVGIGHRGIVDNAIYGVYGFYDYQKSEEKKTYGRISVGLERLTETWDILANFNYYVFKDKNDLVNQGIESGGYEGNDIFFIYAYDSEKVYSGAKIEIGRSLGNPHLRGYVGAYTYGGKINGTSARVQYQINQNISFTASTQRDSARGWLTTAGIQYWIGKVSSYSDDFNLSNRLRDPIMRDMTVAAELDFSHTEKVIDDSRKIYFASPNGTANNNRTDSDPTTLADALSKATSNDVIYMLKGDGTAYDISSGDITLGSGQTLWGAGADFSLNGVVIKSGTSANRPTIEGGSINMTQAGTLGGFTMNGTNSVEDGIKVTHTSGTVTIDNITTSGAFSGAAIDINTSSAVTVKNSTITNTARDGITVAGGGATSISDTSITGNGRHGLNASGSGTTVTLTGDNSITNNDDVGLLANQSGSITMTGGTLTEGSPGVATAAFAQNSGTITITNPTTLTGEIVDSTGGTTQVIVGGTTYQTDAGGKDCTITNGSGSCV